MYFFLTKITFQNYQKKMALSAVFIETIVYPGLLIGH
ncbi:hypothetical protein EV142_11421 [Flavobacterium circumlabens]|uniref:ABC transporter permease n=1 Tax=Flavobacterium circumlabens TaxID=2133765 RepID=A0ABY2AS16_9FLAO|nr:hypothetical protein EV142_11421 [Flavobacterium circumlabens]